MKAYEEHFFEQPLHKINGSIYRIGSDLEGVIIDGVLHIRQINIANNTTCTSPTLLTKDISLTSNSIPFIPSCSAVCKMSIKDFERMYEDNAICKKCFAQLDIQDNFNEYL